MSKIRPYFSPPSCRYLLRDLTTRKIIVLPSKPLQDLTHDEWKSYKSGNCIKCGFSHCTSRGHLSFTYCDNCAKDKETLKELNVCTICMKEDAIIFPRINSVGIFRSNVLCENCYLKKTARRHLGDINFYVKLKEKLELQNRRCPYTGVELVLGDNAELDHVLPKSRYPDLAKSIDNVEWVHTWVNRMKGSMTKQEFIWKYRDFISESFGNYLND